KSDIPPRLYPRPPNLAQEDIRDAQRAFWTVKHGIKMSAMPAWGKTLDDAAIWDVVAFVRQMPAMTPETYQQLSTGHSGYAAATMQLLNSQLAECAPERCERELLERISARDRAAMVEFDRRYE